MKKLIFTILVGMVFLSSCDKKPDYSRDRLMLLSKYNTPISIIWFKLGKTGLEQNHKWCDANEMSEIIALLIESENPAPLNDQYPLKIIFCDRRGNLEYWDDRFEIRGGNYLGLSGTSKQLGEIFLKYVPEEVGSMPPGFDPNRIKEAQKRLQERVRQLKEAKEVNSLTSK